MRASVFRAFESPDDRPKCYDSGVGIMVRARAPPLHPVQSKQRTEKLRSRTTDTQDTNHHRQTKTDIEETERRDDGEAIRRPTAVRGFVPSAAPEQRLGTGRKWAVWGNHGLLLKLPVPTRIPTVLHPFPHIAMNVIESEGIRFQLARRMRAVTGVSAEPPCPHQVFVPVANPVLCCSPARHANSHSASLGSR